MREKCGETDVEDDVRIDQNDYINEDKMLALLTLHVAHPVHTVTRFFGVHANLLSLKKQINKCHGRNVYLFFHIKTYSCFIKNLKTLERLL